MDWAISLPPVGGILVGLAIIIITVVLIVRLLRLPKQVPSSPFFTVAVIGALLSPGIIGWAINLPPFWGVLVGLAIIVADVILIVNLLRLSKQSPSYTITPGQLRLMISRSVTAGLGSAIAMAIPPMTVISATVSMGLITNQLVEVLVGHGFAAQEFTLVELVRDVYLTQASAFLTTLVAAIAAIGLLTIIVSGIMAIPEQLAAQNAKVAQ